MAEKQEERARAEVDRLLAAAGCSVQSMSEANIHAARGVAIHNAAQPTFILQMDRTAACPGFMPAGRMAYNIV